jgi:hypothetical protein
MEMSSLGIREDMKARGDLLCIGLSASFCSHEDPYGVSVVLELGFCFIFFLMVIIHMFISLTRHQEFSKQTQEYKWRYNPLNNAPIGEEKIFKNIWDLVTLNDCLIRSLAPEMIGEWLEVDTDKCRRMFFCLGKC